MQKKESNRFDKIIKENLEGYIFNFAAAFLGVDLPSSKALDPNLQTTLERQPDF